MLHSRIMYGIAVGASVLVDDNLDIPSLISLKRKMKMGSERKCWLKRFSNRDNMLQGNYTV